MITSQEELDAAIAADPSDWHKVGDTNGEWLEARDGAKISAYASSLVYAFDGSQVYAFVGAVIVAHDGAWIYGRAKKKPPS